MADGGEYEHWTITETSGRTELDGRTGLRIYLYRGVVRFLGAYAWRPNVRIDDGPRLRILEPGLAVMQDVCGILVRAMGPFCSRRATFVRVQVR